MCRRARDSRSPELAPALALLVRARRAFRRLRFACALRRTGIPALLERAYLRRLKVRDGCVDVPAAGFTLAVPPRAVVGYLDDRYEPEARTALQELLRPGDVAVDVGAYVGLFTLLMAKAVGPTGSVCAIEPSGANRRLLETNLGRHRQEVGAPVVVHPIACGASNGLGRLTEGGTGECNSLYGDDAVGSEVLVTTLDALVAPPVRLVKIDVEGAEIDVLEGSTVLLGVSDRPHLLVEWNPAAQTRAGRPPTALIEQLCSLGYELTLLDLPGTPAARELDALLAIAHRLPEGWYCNVLAQPEPRAH